MSHRITLQPRGLSFTAQPQENILDAATRAGIRIRKSCQNGVCEICRATLVAGTVHTPEGSFNADHPAVNPLLTCVSQARSDLILELKKVLGPGEIPLQHIAFQIENISQLNDHVYRVELLAPAGKLADYHAGQYLELLIEDGEFPFTIASAPGLRELELHLGVEPDNASSLKILQHLQSHSTVRARLPKGDVWLKPSQNPSNLHDPLIFIVAGTGFAQAKAMIEEQLKHQHSALSLYWVNREAHGFYSELPQQWAQQGLINFHPMTSDKPDCEYFSRHTVEERIAKDISDISQIQVVACGGPGFVYSVLDGLEGKGLKQSQMQSDVFAYAPRT
ncbi:MAG: 2Fe-2S iron-sulfur cluster-binding protein [Bermanella sp.]